MVKKKPNPVIHILLFPFLKKIQKWDLDILNTGLTFRVGKIPLEKIHNCIGLCQESCTASEFHLINHQPYCYTNTKLPARYTHSFYTSINRKVRNLEIENGRSLMFWGFFWGGGGVMSL